MILLNGERRELASGISVAELIEALGLRPEHVAVERNRELIPRPRHPEVRLSEGDSLEIVTLVGGGAPGPDVPPLTIGGHRFRSRLLVGTGKYSSLELMRDCLEASGTEVVTVAVRRERLADETGRKLLDFIDPARYTILPNTAGCFSADDALRTARMGREILLGLENPGADWVKLEVLADTRTLLPDPIATLEATRVLVKEGFQVLCYTSDDPIMARRLKAEGAASVMPAGSPIGSGQGVLNPNNLLMILEDLKAGDPSYPVIVDAGVGTASDVAIAMEPRLRRGVAQHRDRRGARRVADGPCDADGDRSRLSGVPRRANLEEALRHGEQSHRRARHVLMIQFVATSSRKTAGCRASIPFRSSGPTEPSRVGCWDTRRAPSRSAWPRRSPRRSKARII